MKIGHPADKPVAPQATGSQGVAPEAAQAGQAAAAAVAPVTSGADASAKVELSSTASTLLSTGGTSEFNADKVTKVSDSIANGTFKVNPEAIADKLIANAQELLGKVQG
jgi:negative regulator of flagellin synthesis FlgM